MAGKGVRGLTEALKSLNLSSQACREAASYRIPSTTFTRSMATEVPLPKLTTTLDHTVSNLWRPSQTVSVTIFDFPSYEPKRLEEWSSKHLHLPLRRDILHLAVVYEGDNTRQGTASSKTRFEVHGSHRKLRPQKGLGRARVGTKQSPILRGGGKVFGPKPRDFGTKLNKKVYDLAWRTALSYRYRRGELVVCDDGMELDLPEEFKGMVGELEDELVDGFRAKWVKQVLDRNEWGRSSGRSTFITGARRNDLFDALDLVPKYGRALDVENVDVKDLLETGRLVVERAALKELIARHQSDLVSNIYVHGVKPPAPKSGIVVVE
ncbi:50S ribosomal protein L4 [Pseudomassariella vexata]|uniref:Large ribosomal subunit protein uL4m n=1 Tax=Pseudomassariella vexata TaxID=1141098 RepID=A0A1Y2EM95_9PEZI|nr:50S ribosomal protein L4 [Pseudomassariella vexata]ORY71955.1 50S ribosomal protein L4 [Pseudomassariella vexata]